MKQGDSGPRVWELITGILLVIVGLAAIWVLIENFRATQAFAMHVGECPAPWPGITEAIGKLPPGLAKKLTDSLDHGRSDQAALRRLIRDYPSARVQQWRQDPTESRKNVITPSLRRLLLNAANDPALEPCVEERVSLIGELRAAPITMGDSLRTYYVLTAIDGQRYRVDWDGDAPQGTVRVDGMMLGHDVLADAISDGSAAATTVVPTVPPNAPTMGPVRLLLVGTHIDGGVDPLISAITASANTLKA